MKAQLDTATHESFDKFCQGMFSKLEHDEELAISLHQEHSTFIRLNQANVRQASYIEQGNASLKFLKDGKTVNYDIPWTERILDTTSNYLDALRYYAHTCSPDPFFSPLPEPSTSFHSSDRCHNISVTDILKRVRYEDVAGLLCYGPIIKAYQDSRGGNHWFGDMSFFFDYSLYTEHQKAIKRMYSGHSWNVDAFEKQYHEATRQLIYLKRDSIALTPKPYRVYLSPYAIESLVGMLSWNGVSYQSFKQGECALTQLQRGEKKLSPLFSLYEDYTSSPVPRFSNEGTLAPARLSIIEKGQLENLMISRRTAKEYSLESNNASSFEGLRSASVAPGTLMPEDILTSLGTGIYVDYLHYLNWSDTLHGRLTGMTRYACFWVENGEIVAPINDMRFDDSLYAFWGKNLEAVGTNIETLLSTSTYESRSLEATHVPGMIVNDFMLTS